ncbi:hypothetical protein BDZ97DRAFT_1878170 [Flammula alnicola]|nr:hypothetical protein BDZ97DRAFT_1878170 [Flammula alnicola]
MASIDPHSLPLLQERSTIDSLPPELLAFIFTLAHSKHRFPHKIPFEVELSHVSSTWREVAQTTSALWTRIDVYSPQSMKWVPSYLRRSGSHMPLDVYIDVYRWDMLHPMNVNQARIVLARTISQEIVPYLQRVRNLSIVCYHEFTATSIQGFLADTSAPTLQCLNVQFDHTVPTMPRHPTGFKIFARGSPQLTFLDTAFAGCLPPPTSLQNLTTLFLHPLQQSLDLRYRDFVDILTAPRSLANLSITGSTQTLLRTWPLHLLEPDIELPNLKSLRLIMIDNSMFSAKLLLSISAPKLESLWLHCSFDNYNFLFDASQMATVAGRTPKFSNLRYLTILQDSLFHSVKFAQIFPNITHLHLPHANFFHVDKLEAGLSGHWRQLHTLVLTLLREVHAQKLTNVLTSVFQPSPRDRDFARMLQENAPQLPRLVNIINISPDNYREPWWAKLTEASAKTGLPSARREFSR